MACASPGHSPCPRLGRNDWLSSRATKTYLADFRSVAEWDPSVKESRHVNGDDPIKVGALFRVTTGTRLRDIVLDYETVELDRPRTIVLRGENGSMVLRDSITIADRVGGGSEITDDATVDLKGVRRIADPLLQLGFGKLGDNARDSLRAKLNHDD